MAAKLRDVQDAMNGGGQASQIEIGSTISLNADHAPAEKPQYIVFKLVDKKANKLNLDGIKHDVVNPKNGEYDTIRLIRGAKSIWTSELTEILKDKDYISKNRISPKFDGGVCRVPLRDVKTLEFLRVHPSNVGDVRNGSGKYDFYEYNPEMEQKKKHEQRMGRINLIQTIAEMPEDKMLKVALFLGVKPTDDEIGLPRTPSGMRTELLILADTKTDIVAKYINSAEVEISYMVRKAIMEAKIDLGGQSGNIIWSGGGGHIARVPTNRKPLEYLTELAMTNSSEGRQFKEQLESIIT